MTALRVVKSSINDIWQYYRQQNNNNNINKIESNEMDVVYLSSIVEIRWTNKYDSVSYQSNDRASGSRIDNDTMTWCYYLDLSLFICQVQAKFRIFSLILFQNLMSLIHMLTTCIFFHYNFLCYHRCFACPMLRCCVLYPMLQCCNILLQYILSSIDNQKYCSLL